MARPGQLAVAIAEEFDLDPTTVRQQARMLRDAGLMAMERGGRGKGSMTPRDAVHLLLAAAGASRVKHSIIPINQQGACKSREGVWNLPFDGVSELVALGAQHTLSEALEALVHAAIRGLANSDSRHLWANEHGEYYRNALMIRVSVEEPSAHSKIEIGLLEQDEQNTKTMKRPVARTYASQWTADGHFDPPVFVASSSDLTHVHTFSQRTIVRIAQEFNQG